MQLQEVAAMAMMEQREGASAAADGEAYWMGGVATIVLGGGASVLVRGVRAQWGSCTVDGWAAPTAAVVPLADASGLPAAALAAWLSSHPPPPAATIVVLPAGSCAAERGGGDDAAQAGSLLLPPGGGLLARLAPAVAVVDVLYAPGAAPAPGWRAEAGLAALGASKASAPALREAAAVMLETLLLEGGAGRPAVAAAVADTLPVPPAGGSLRDRIARDLLGPLQHSMYESPDSDGGSVTPQAQADGSGGGGGSVAALLELQASSLARGNFILEMMLKPVMFSAMKPVINTVVNMVSPSIMENVQENVQHRIVEQLPDDVAAAINAAGAGVLTDQLVNALAASLGPSLGAAITRSTGLHLLATLPPAIIPRAVTAVTRTVTDTVVRDTGRRLGTAVGAALARDMGSVATRAITHALVSTLSAALAPVHLPPPTPADAALRRTHCDVCAGLRAGTIARRPPTSTLDAAASTADGGVPVPAWAPPDLLESAADALHAAGGAGPHADALACFLCEERPAGERAVAAHVTQQLAHAYAEYYSRYYATYAAAAAAAADPASPAPTPGAKPTQTQTSKQT